ncbi:hypothetical protein I6E29_04905 [Arcanobacterium haemolyticum]|nr:hypothetical protein [Arcanobacterium haemolyticum]
MEPDSPSHLASAISSWAANERWFRGTDIADAASNAWEYGTTQSGARLVWLCAGMYNIPLVMRRDPTSHGPAIATCGSWHIYDATADEEGQLALFHLSFSSAPASFTSTPHVPEPTVLSAHKLTSEQSNTSIVYALADGTRAIVKLFRVFTAGHNPDVEVQGALAETGIVPRQLTSTRLANGKDEADVLVVHEFLEGATDAWQVMSDALRNCDGTLGELEPRIVDLGTITRRMHDELASRLETAPADGEHIVAIRESWRERARAAIEAVPELAEYEGEIEIMYIATAHVNWPRFQRIHGDYHLGQVIDVPGLGWRILDFEGEPLRPLAERVTPDLALRDVAGMIRSFAYAIGAQLLAGGNPEHLETWRSQAVNAFLRGYGEISEEDRILLDAFMLDKALYEVSYEAASRPSWLPIPVAGVRRFIGRD